MSELSHGSGDRVRSPLPCSEEIGSAGLQVEDSYAWLEDDDSAATQLWLDAQNEGFVAARALWSSTTEWFRYNLKDRAGDPAEAALLSAPVWRGTSRFELRCDPDTSQNVLMSIDDDGTEKIVFDPSVADEIVGRSIIAWRPSWSGKLVACQLSVGGSEEPELRVVEVASGGLVGSVLSPGRPTPIAWSSDDSGFYYVTSPRGGRRGIRRHKLGETPESDERVFDTDSHQLSVAIAPEGQWLLVSCAPGAQRGNQLYLIDLTARAEEIVETAAPRLVHDGTVTGHQAWLKFGPGSLLYGVRTARDESGVLGHQVCVVDPGFGVSPGSWRPVVTVPEPATLIGCVALRTSTADRPHFLVATNEAGTSRVALFDAKGDQVDDDLLRGQEPGVVKSVSGSHDRPGCAWFIYSNLFTVPELYQFDLRDRSCGPFTPHRSSSVARDAEIHRYLVEARDGAEIPVTIVVPSSVDEKPRPTMLTAYGGFGATPVLSYSPSVLAWLAAGGNYVFAGVRGGGDRGSSWHEAGKGLNKPNTFHDVDAVARWLLDNGWTGRDQLAIRGGSHAGLTAAVALVGSPELYSAAVCHGPLTDMIRYPHLGIGRWWIGEFGNPDSSTHRQVLLSYSPYHLIDAGIRYPPTMVISARRDERVGAAHSRKLIAALQRASSQLAVLRTDDGVGHAPDTADARLDIEAETLSFCAFHAGLLVQ